MPNPQFSNDEIRQRAYLIYQARGCKPGDPNADWQEAIRQLQQEHLAKQQRSVFFWLNRPLVWMEKRAVEPTANWLDKADIFRIVEKISPVVEAIGVFIGAILIPVLIWQLSERAQDAQEKQAKAVRAQTAVQNYLNQLSATLATWKLETDTDLQKIVRASTLALLDSPDLQPDPDSQPDPNSNLSPYLTSENCLGDRKGQVIRYLSETSLIRIEASEQLQDNNQVNVKRTPTISLENADLSCAVVLGANLRGADLSKANLMSADLMSADLNGAILLDAGLSNAILSGADLSDVDLRGAFLYEANLSNADLSGADLSHGPPFYPSGIVLLGSVTYLDGASLQRTNLSDANLALASLINTDLSGANFSRTNLRGSVLYSANLSYADLTTAKNWTVEQLATAKLCETKLPAGTNLDPNRDCKELKISPD